MKFIAEWEKPKEGDKEPEKVEVRVHGFSTSSFGDTIRPVAIVSEIKTGAMKFVEVKFLKYVRACEFEACQ